MKSNLIRSPHQGHCGRGTNNSMTRKAKRIITKIKPLFLSSNALAFTGFVDVEG